MMDFLGALLVFGLGLYVIHLKFRLFGASRFGLFEKKDADDVADGAPIARGSALPRQNSIEEPAEDRQKD